MINEGYRRTTSNIAVVRIYTRKGDDGTTGLLYGGRVRKDDAVIEANGAVDEAQAALGVAEQRPRRVGARCAAGGLERDLWVLMARWRPPPQPAQVGPRHQPGDQGHGHGP